MLIVIAYTFNNSSKITRRFVHVTITIVQRSYILIDSITLLITSEDHSYMQSILRISVDLHEKYVVNRAFDHNSKLVDAC